MIEQFKKLIDDFAKNIGLEDVSVNEEGECVLGVDDFMLTISLQGSTVLFYSPVGSAQNKNKEELYAKLLHANYFYSQTNGATLGVNPFSLEVQLIYREQLQMLDTSTISTILEIFLDRVEYWNKVCTDNESVNNNDKETQTVINSENMLRA